MRFELTPTHISCLCKVSRSQYLNLLSFSTYKKRFTIKHQKNRTVYHIYQIQKIVFLIQYQNYFFSCTFYGTCVTLLFEIITLMVCRADELSSNCQITSSVHTYRLFSCKLNTKCSSLFDKDTNFLNSLYKNYFPQDENGVY